MCVCVCAHVRMRAHIQVGAPHFKRQLIWRWFVGAMLSNFMLNMIVSGTVLDGGSCKHTWQRAMDHLCNKGKTCSILAQHKCNTHVVYLTHTWNILTPSTQRTCNIHAADMQ